MLRLEIFQTIVGYVILQQKSILIVPVCICQFMKMDLIKEHAGQRLNINYLTQKQPPKCVKTERTA